MLKCKQCGKWFSDFLIDVDSYAYKYKGKHFCSYTCMQKYKKEHKSRYNLVKDNRKDIL